MAEGKSSVIEEKLQRKKPCLGSRFPSEVLLLPLPQEQRMENQGKS